MQAVRTVAQGRKYVTPEIAQMLVESLTAPVTEQAHERLSDRELQTLVMIASGKRLSDIAEELMLSPKTVSVYRARVLEKLGLAQQLRDDGLRDPQRAGGRLIRARLALLSRLVSEGPVSEGRAWKHCQNRFEAVCFTLRAAVRCDRLRRLPRAAR